MERERERGLVSQPPAKRRKPSPVVPTRGGGGGGGGGQVASPRWRRLRQTLLLVLFLARSRTTVTASISQLGRMFQRYVDCTFNKYQEMISSKLESFQEQIEEKIEGLRHEVTRLSHLCSNRYTDQQTRVVENQEQIAANGSNTNTRLCFLNGLEPPVYTDENLTSHNHAAIKLAMFEGENVVTSGALSKAKIEILVLRGDFSNKCRDNWTEDEFDKHILQGRDGHDLVLGTVWLTNGMAELSQIRFREGSCRRNVIMAARVCKSKKTSCRVQEAIMKPVKVLDRRNKQNEKRHPPSPNDDVYRLEEIAKDGAYHKRLQEVQIYDVGDFLKALNDDSSKLRVILKMENQQNAWSKLTKHARECVLEDRQELKRYHSKDGTGTAQKLPQVEHGTPYQIVDCGPIVAGTDYLNTPYCQDQGIPLHGGQQQVISPWPQNPQGMMDFDYQIELPDFDMYQDSGASTSAQAELMFGPHNPTQPESTSPAAAPPWMPPMAEQDQGRSCSGFPRSDHPNDFE